MESRKKKFHLFSRKIIIENNFSIRIGSKIIVSNKFLVHWKCNFIPFRPQTNRFFSLLTALTLSLLSPTLLLSLKTMKYNLNWISDFDSCLSQIEKNREINYKKHLTYNLYAIKDNIYFGRKKRNFESQNRKTILGIETSPEIQIVLGVSGVPGNEHGISWGSLSEWTTDTRLKCFTFLEWGSKIWKQYSCKRLIGFRNK